MAVQILDNMPDAAVHRGDPPALADWSPRASIRGRSSSNRPMFIAITIGVHLLAAAGFLSMRHVQRVEAPPVPIEASIIDAANYDEAPPAVSPPVSEIVYALPMPDQISIETEAVTPQPVVNTTAISETVPRAVAPPMVENVEYMRPPAPVYPEESRRRRERGTVVLRVLVDADGRPAQIQVESSSGYPRLDHAAYEAVRKALFRPYEVGGIAQPAQVRIPIEFMRRAS